MKTVKNYAGYAAAVGMLVCILDTKTALTGACEGLQLCILTVIPSLFPFFVLSSLITGSLTGTSIPILRPFAKFLQVPEGSESILAAGFLGGYPIGAQMIGEAVRSQTITAADGKRLLAFCNNAGPAFLFGMGSVLFPELWMCWALWGIHIVSAVLVSFYFPAPESRSAGTLPLAKRTPALTASLRAMAHVCGWIILFRVILAFLDRWFGWILPSVCTVILTGFLELSLGCLSLAEIPDIGLRFLLCSAFLGFGGICVVMQSRSASLDVDFRYYLPGKLLHGSISFTLSAALHFFVNLESTAGITPVAPSALILCHLILLFFCRRKNRCGNFRLLRV